MVGQPNELYGSHLPILTRVMDLTHGAVLELGMGLYSTPLLHTMCKLQGRKLVSIDNDQKWFEENKKWEDKNHDVILVDKDDDFNFVFYDSKKELFPERVWSVAFVDEKPAKHRIKSIRGLAHNTMIIVIHDSEPVSDKYFKYRWIYKLFKYRYDYTALTPNTTVLSNFVDVSKLLQ